jgi:hypothetical protein
VRGIGERPRRTALRVDDRAMQVDEIHSAVSPDQGRERGKPWRGALRVERAQPDTPDGDAGFQVQRAPKGRFSPRQLHAKSLTGPLMAFHA